MNGIIADVLRTFANERADDWPELVPLVEFAINDSLSPLGSGFTPFYADRGQHPRAPSPRQHHPTLRSLRATGRRPPTK